MTKNSSSADSDLRSLYATYAVIAETCSLATPPFKQGETIADAQALAKAQQWIRQLDDQVQPQHIRRVLRTDLVSSESRLGVLIRHHLANPKKTDLDRNKLDFLLAEYFCTCGPPALQDRVVTPFEVADVLQPVIGRVAPFAPDIEVLIDEVVRLLKSCESLRDLKRLAIIEQGRQIKNTCGQRYFDPEVLVMFTYMNYMVRAESARLMNADLAAIGVALRALEARGAQFVDCTGAGLGEQEPLDELISQWRTWEVPFQSDYLTWESFDKVLSLRQAVEDALSPSLERRVEHLARQLAELQNVVAELSARIKTQPAETAKAEAAVAAAAASAPVAATTAAPPAPVAKAAPAPQKDSAPEARAQSAAPPAAVPSAPKTTPAPAAPAPAKPAAAPEVKSETAAPAVPAAAEKPASPSRPAEDKKLAEAEPSTLGQWMDKLKHLVAANIKGQPSAASVVVGNVRTLMLPVEVAAFVRSDELSTTVQHCVAARFLLIEAMAFADKQGGKARLEEVVKIAREEYAKVEQQVKKRREANQREGEEKLLATAQQLASMLKRAAQPNGGK
jgi:hypothetical protein